MHVVPLLLSIASMQTGSVVVPPYVQLGSNGSAVEVRWHTSTPSPLPLTFRSGNAGSRSAVPLPSIKVALGKSPVHYVQRALVGGTPSGSRVEYQVGRYRGTFVTPKSPGQAFSFIAVGDIGRGTPGQRKLAPKLLSQNADFAVLLGDIAYPYGRVADYRKYFFPIQNSDASSPQIGAPFLRNTLTIPVAGNHDVAYRNLAKYPDGLAYYAYWSAPLNGPNLPHKVQGSPAAIAALDSASGGNLKRMGNYSFTYGNSRWIVLDANHYVNWRDPILRRWLETELQRSQGATWSFVAMHAPAYHSSKKHASDTQMRGIADLLTKYKVDIVFAGHLHNYQRSKPLRTVNGQLQIDETFDGIRSTKPDGTIHIVSGAGGAELYDRSQTDQPTTWQRYTAKFKSIYSFTQVNVTGRELFLRQIDSDGRTLDNIRLTK